MRKLTAAILTAGAVAVAGPVLAADVPQYPPVIKIPHLPPVDYGLEGSFYLRGSVAANAMWAREITYDDCVPCGVALVVNPTAEWGYGYSLGAGIGYETGTGLRTDVTVDYLSNTGLSDGTYTLALRSTIGLANFYYDFFFGGSEFGSAAGGFGAYVGAGVGVAYNQTSVTGGTAPGADGANWGAAGAVMTGVTYDMGAIVADLGYRGLYLPQITNGDAATLPSSPYYINDAWIHEVRATARYRF